MKANRKPPFSYNLFFLIPFMIWVILGGAVQFFFNKQELFAFVNTHYNTVADSMLYFLTFMGEGTVIFPVLLFCWLYKKENRTRPFFFAILLANIGAFLLAQAIKNIVNAPRPLNVFDDAAWVHVLPNWKHYYHNSFPSGHTTGAFAMFSFVAFILKKSYRFWGLAFFILALTVAYSRLYLAAHFFLDVYVGSIIGTVFSILAVSIFFQQEKLRSNDTL